MSKLISSSLVIVISLCLCGCQNPNDPVNQSIDKFEKAATGVFNKVNKDSVVTSGQMNGDLALKEPGYHYKGLGIFGTCIYIDGEIYIKGAEGKMMGGISLAGKPEISTSQPSN